MKTTALTLTALLMGSAAFGQTTVDDVIADFTNQGYTRIEIKTRLTTIEVDARKQGTRHRATYNRITGALIEENFDSDDDGSDDGSDGASDEGSDDGSDDGSGSGSGDGSGDGSGSGSGDGSGDGSGSGSGEGSGSGSGDGSGSGSGEGSGSGSGSGDTAFLNIPDINYLNGGQERDIEFG